MRIFCLDNLRILNNNYRFSLNFLELRINLLLVLVHMVFYAGLYSLLNEKVYSVSEFIR